MSTGSAAQARSTADPALVAEFRAYLAELSEGKLSADAIDPGSHLFDFGYVDSLSAVLFTAHLEERYGVRIEEVDLLERFTTLEAVAVHVAESRRPA